MAERQQVQDLAQLKELLAPTGERIAETIDGIVLITGADNHRYEVPMALLAPLIEAHARLRMTMEILARYARTFDDDKPTPTTTVTLAATDELGRLAP